MINLNEMLELVKEASTNPSFFNEKSINEILVAIADEAMVQSSYILTENEKDLAKIEADSPKYDNLKLSLEQLKTMTDEIRRIADLPSSLGKITGEVTCPNGLSLKRVNVPFGVVAFIYETSPNIVFYVSALCLKSGNACILKCGSEAWYTNRAMTNVIHSVLEWYDFNPHLVELFPADRKSSVALLNALGYVNLIVPYGSNALVDYVRTYATVPVIVTGSGVSHIYFDVDGDLKKGAEILYNAKTWNEKNGNAVDCLIIHKERLNDLPVLCAKLQEAQITIYADEVAYMMLQEYYPMELLKLATTKHFRTEFASKKMAVKTVSFFADVLEHIGKYGGRYSECIITENDEVAQLFEKLVDAACVYVNASPAFTDGEEFGMGAWIGVSTQKLHVRGPIGLEALNSYKWVINGKGQIR